MADIVSAVKGKIVQVSTGFTNEKTGMAPGEVSFRKNMDWIINFLSIENAEN